LIFLSIPDPNRHRIPDLDSQHGIIYLFIFDVTCCSDSSVIGHSFAPTATTDSLAEKKTFADKQRKPHGSAISAPIQTEAPSASSAISAPVQTEAPSASSAISTPVQTEAPLASSAATRGLETTNLTPEQEVLRPPPAAASTVSSCDDLFGDSVNDDMFRDEFPSQLPPDRKVVRINNGFAYVGL
jgi:hypothetical protein